MGVTIRRWSVELDGHRRTVELEHRTWWHRATVRVDGAVVANEGINLAIGYEHAAGLSLAVDEHRLDVAIRADGSFRPTYRYALSVDGNPVAGSDDVTPVTTTPVRPALPGITEQIIWAAVVIGVFRTLSISPLRAIALIPAPIIASWILRRADMPPSWRVVGAVLLVVAWVLGASLLTGAFDPPRGV